MLMDIIIHGVLHVTPLATHDHRGSPPGEPDDEVNILDLNLEDVTPYLKYLQIWVPHVDQSILESHLLSHIVGMEEFQQTTVSQCLDAHRAM